MKSTELALRPSYWASVSGGKDSLLLKECDIDCGFAMTSEKIYTAGYRKIDDDCAVITKAELK